MAGQDAAPTESYTNFGIERKEPLTDARHVRDAIAHFDQVEASATPSEEGMEADRGRGQAL